jgi:sorting nexin-25
MWLRMKTLRALPYVLALLFVLPWLSNLILSPVFIILGIIVALVITAVLVFTSNILFGVLLDKYYTTSPSIIEKRTLGRMLKFSTPAAWQAALTKNQWSYKAPNSFPPLIPDYPIVSRSLNDIMIFIVRDFILTWYKDISSSPAFPTAVSAIMHSSLETLLTRLSHLDLPELLVRKILPHVALHVRRFRDSEMVIRGSALERHLTRSEELDILVASRYAASGNLHSAISNLSTMTTRQDEEAYFRRVLESILPLVLPSKEASKILTIAAREILSCGVLAPVMDAISDPDFWTRAIDQAVSVSTPFVHLAQLSKAGEAIQQQFSRRLNRKQRSLTIYKENDFTSQKSP